MQTSFVIAIDGPAASGKGTLARLISENYAFAHLDTGSLYRGVAHLLLSSGKDPPDADAAERVAENFDISQIEGVDLRTRPVTAASSVVAAYPAVRAALLDYQRRFALRPPNGARGAVLDGRDIGTVVCPDAHVKFFVTASPAIRARRRWEELLPTRPELSESEVLEDILARDKRDSERSDAPMTRAPDAQLLDTTHLSIDAAFAAARRVIDGALRRCES